MNNEVATALEQPTLTPTPLIVSVILPSGHTPPTSPDGARPNEAEIPGHLKPLVQSLANIPVPTPGPEHAIRIQIPSIGVDAPIVQGDGWEQLKKGVGQHIGSSNPGEKGNVVLSAHNDIFGEIFRELDRLQPGDTITLYTNQRAYNYVVSTSEVIEPTQVEVMDSTSQPTITLISCYPYLVDDQRIAITGRMQTESNWTYGVLRILMSKKSKRKSRPIPTSETSSRSSSSRNRPDDFNPDYSYVIKDLRHIGVLAAIFISALVILSLFLRWTYRLDLI